MNLLGFIRDPLFLKLLEGIKIQSLYVFCDADSVSGENLKCASFFLSFFLLFIIRYDELWMPLISDLMVGISPPMILPPLDIEWVWFCHTLNPVFYYLNSIK